jgi:LysM repeat protein
MRTYTVKPVDNLSKIADVSVKQYFGQILSRFSGSNPDSLVGQDLIFKVRNRANFEK